MPDRTRRREERRYGPGSYDSDGSPVQPSGEFTVVLIVDPPRWTRTVHSGRPQRARMDECARTWLMEEEMQTHTQTMVNERAVGKKESVSSRRL
jgi:hypothetical protein